MSKHPPLLDDSDAPLLADDAHLPGRSSDSDSEPEHSPLVVPAASTNLSEIDDSMPEPKALPPDATAAVPPKLTMRETAHLAILFCLLWFGANYTANASLAYTSVSSSMIFSTTSGMWTLLFGALARVDFLSIGKFSSVLAVLGGVVMVALTDASGDTSGSGSSGSGAPLPPNPLLGDLLALGGAILYGLYIVLLKLRIGHEERMNSQLFFAFVGLFNVLLLWPLLLIAHYTGLEPFELPPTSLVFWALILNGLLGTVASDFLWLRAMLMTSPVIVTLGLSLTIPGALLAEALIAAFGGSGVSIPDSWVYWMGVVLVMIGFVAVNASSILGAKYDPTAGAAPAPAKAASPPAARVTPAAEEAAPRQMQGQAPAISEAPSVVTAQFVLLAPVAEVVRRLLPSKPHTG
ncbi:hypothetical protein, variant [Fonticula alba]|uniref:EamA domain-containing protein n=1 Tax=Fonticula alba TaxID=691883 RepID=A0A058Z9L4_FONAL|nr:hypothetical protein, variant [Fonticula alba]KCV70608.1 hypothetical protein, variant [Fonticula alba]|eukprot:XP_009495124.1 hypothetical protein, variant [Fonticula alba]